MREKLIEMKERAGQFWQSLQIWQRASMVASAVLVLGGLIALGVVAGKTGYEPIFSGLEPNDQAAVIQYLKDESIPYRTDSASNSILVPTASVYESRIALAAKGVPTGGYKGFERFDETKLGQTTFQEKMTYYRALEGELSRTISEMAPVRRARVSIVVPEQRLFLEQQQPSTAAVLLTLKPGMTIGQEQARAILHLVSHSVEGLLPENVTLADSSGQVSFADLLDDALTVQTGSKTELKQRVFERNYEAELEKKVKDMLEKIFGPGKVKAAIRVELDFDKRQASSRQVFPLPDAKAGVVQSSQNTEESYSGPAGIYGGPPGTTSNIPGYAINTGQNNMPAQYDRADVVTNYDNSTQESQQVESQGKIKRLTATVLISNKLSQRELDTFRDSVATAIGYNETRGDKISMVAREFDRSAEEKLQAQLADERKQQMIIGVSSFIIFLIALGVALFLWQRRRKRLAALAAASRAASEAGEGTPSLRELLENPDLMTSQGELSVLEEQLRNYAMNNPEEFANLIKNWVVDDI
ncbi:flagellar M-ring protein [Synergistales bacterium]|nr:flagellar M-ring protein [Synergistales bacterium]